MIETTMGNILPCIFEHTQKKICFSVRQPALLKKRISIVRKCFMFFGVGKCYAFSKYVYNNPTLLISVDLETFFHRSSSFHCHRALPLWKNKITDFLLLFCNAVRWNVEQQDIRLIGRTIFLGQQTKNPFKVEEHPSIFLKSCNFVSLFAPSFLCLSA